VLIGGSNRTISLQPVSIEGNTGLNVAAGIGAITLHLVRWAGERLPGSRWRISDLAFDRVSRPRQDPLEPIAAAGWRFSGKRDDIL